MDGTETVQRTATDNQPADRARPHQQVRVQTGDALRDGKLASVLTDQLMGNGDHIAGNGKAAERDMAAVGD